MNLSKKWFLLLIYLFQADCADRDMLGIYAVKMSTKEVVIDQESDQSFVPSSCMKIVTTGAALHLLGPKLRFTTHLEYDGSISRKKRLRGHVYIRGGGDPCLGSDRIAGSLSWKKQIDVWADTIENLGIKQIDGKVIGDASKWEKALAVPSWLWEDLGNYYGAGACALSFHENLYSIIFSPGKNIGDQTTILRADPPDLLHTLQNEVTTGPSDSGDRAWVYGAEYFPVQFVRGTIPAATDEFSIKGAIPDPATWCASLLAKELSKRGIKIKNKPLAQSEETAVIHETQSPTVGEIVHFTNQKSINLYAEHLLKKMGEGTTEAGTRAISAFWKSQGIDLKGFYMADGSGLSRKNRLTPKQLVEMLLIMKQSNDFPLFLGSLPKKGSTRAKGGSMTFSRGLAGYFGDIAFAILINDPADNQSLNQKLNSALCKVLESEQLPLDTCPR